MTWWDRSAEKGTMRTLSLILMIQVAAAFRAAPFPQRVVRPAIDVSLAPAMLTPDMLLPDGSFATAAHDALNFVGTLLAEEAESEEITPLLIAQMGVIVAMIGGGTALEIWGDVEEPEEEGAEDGAVDIYRDTALRYMGYANEVGEAFRPLVPVAVVYATYVGAIGYILADTVDKFQKGQTGKDLLVPVISATDVFCWQMLASVSGGKDCRGFGMRACA